MLDKNRSGVGDTMRFGYTTFNKWVMGTWRRGKRGIPKGAKAAMIDLKKKFDTDRQSLDDLPARAKAIIAEQKAAKNSTKNHV